MRLHKSQRAVAEPGGGGKSFYSTPVQAESGHSCHDWVTVPFASGFLGVFGSGETPVGDRPLGSRYRQVERQVQALQSSVLLGWHEPQHGDRRDMASKGWGAQHPCQWPHNVPSKGEEQGQDYLEHAMGAALQYLKGLHVSSVCSFSAASTSPFTSCSGWYT